MIEEENKLDEETNRPVWINNPEKNAELKYSSNLTVTTKYTPWNFLFKNMVEQFRRLANFYFLLVVVIELIPTVSPLSPMASITPLVFVLLVTAIKDGYEDWKRGKADKEINEQKTKVLKNGDWQETMWKDVEVGDLLHLIDDEAIPADVVPISCSHKTGDVYIETCNLDGESGIKIRHCVNPDLSKIKSKEELDSMKGYIDTPEPNIQLDSFDAKFALENKEPLPLNENQILLRGSRIQKTEWVNAIVVYTGNWLFD